MVSLTLWTWVWASSRSWWWTGKPDVLQSMGSQRVGHDWAAELTELKFANILFEDYFIDVLSRNWLFFGSFIVWFWHQGNEGFIEWVWQYFLTFNFTENLRRMGPNYSLNVWRITLWSHGVLYIRNQQNMAHEPVHSAIYFVNRFCWNIRKLIYLCIIHNLFHETMAEFSSCNRMNGLQRQKIFTILPFIEEVCNPLFYIISHHGNAS